MTLILVGQSELWDRFKLQSYAAIRQRIDLQCKLPHLDRAQVGEYVKNYLAYAGAEHDIFSDNAVDEIFKFSSGAARMVNKVCTYCLLYGAQNSKIITAFQSLRGVGLITAATIVAEAGDLSRFDSPKQLMSYVGLVPSEFSSGGNRHQGRITKSGNAHIRRVIVESAWHYRRQPSIGVGLKKRQEGQSEEIKAISWQAQHRLNLKFRRLSGRGKPSKTAAVAVARELLGFLWAIAQETRQKNNLQKIS